MVYVSERVVNIAELEKYIQNALITCNLMKKQLPLSPLVEESMEVVINDLEKAHNFEFCVERRKTIDKVD